MADQPMSQWPSTHQFVIPVRGGDEKVKLTIDGREVEARNGELLIRVAQENGTYIPRFCYHERMKPVGMCRQCLVEVEGMRGFQISCATPVADGMVVHTQSDAVKKVQEGVLEFLLINHPLDCPVCDRGGECPLQDQTMAYGPGESRFVEEKRHWAKPIPVNDLVYLDRERCIQCGRCTRFAAEVAGEPMIDFGFRTMATEVITFPDEPFSPYFSINTVQICPVGALTSRPYRFKARPWDLKTAETSCTLCAVNCRVAVDSSANRMLRLLGVDSEPVNQGWLCDKGRLSYESVHADGRIRRPMVRGDDGDRSLVEVSWTAALDAAAEGLRLALDRTGPSGVAVVGGARGTNEDAYAWARFAKGVLRTDNVDAQLGDGLPASVVLGMERAAIPDLDRARAVVLLGPDVEEELPVLHLRLRRAAVDLKVPVVELSTTETSFTRYAAASLRYVPGEQAELARKVASALGGAPTGDPDVDAVGGLVDGRDGDVVVVLGRPSLAESADHTVAAAAALAGPGVRFLSALRRGNVHGALEAGLAPGILPGRVGLDAGREWFTREWGAVPDAPGLGTTGVLQAARDGRIDALVVLGADLVDDFPDRTLAREAILSAGFVIVVGSFASELTSQADVFLPATMWGEKAGSTTNIEGRVQRLAQKVAPEGSVMDDWRIAAELARRFGVDFDLELVSEIQDEMARVAPSFADVGSSLLARAIDGVVLPLADHVDDLVLTPTRIPLTDRRWEPIIPGTVGDGIAGVSVGPALPTGAAGAAVAFLSTEGRRPSGDEPPADPGGAGPGAEAAGAAEAGASGPDTDDAAAGEAREEPTDAAGGGGPAVPATLRWDPSAATAPGAAARDAYALRFVSGHSLYDLGRSVAGSVSMGQLVRPAALLVHPAELERLGVADGDTLRVSSGREPVSLPVAAHPGVPEGVAYLPFNRPPVPASALIDATAPVTDLRLEATP